jgi:C4-dicarboxylate transporter, DctM subunit
MTNEIIGLLGIGGLITLLLLRVPVAVAMILAAFAGYTTMAGPFQAFHVMAAVPHQIGTEYTMSVIPLFVLMGTLASQMRLSARLFEGAGALFGHTPGSSAMATIGASAAFGAICGSSLATTATIGRIAIPEMRRTGYKDTLTSGSVAAGGTLGILIPPSIILVIYGIIAELSIERLFAAALIPGLVLAAFYLLTVQVFLLWDPEAAPPSEPRSLLERIRRIGGMWEIAVLFGMSIGGLYAGLFTPTEAASVGAGMALLIGFATRRLSLRQIHSAILEAVVTTATLFFVVLGATLLAYFFIQARIPPLLVQTVAGLNLSPVTVMALLVLCYVIAGCFLEGIGLVLATVPVFFPLVKAIGFDPIWFGVVVVVVVEIGLIHLPVGMNLFVIKAQAPDMDLMAIYKGTLPFLGAQFLLIVLLITFPAIALWFPGFVFGQ